MCLALRASGLWLHYAALQNLYPFLSLDCAPTPSTLAQSKERKGSIFAIWQPCLGFPHLRLSQSRESQNCGIEREERRLIFVVRPESLLLRRSGKKEGGKGGSFLSFPAFLHEVTLLRDEQQER